MIVTIQHEGTTVTVRNDDAVHISDVIYEVIVPALLAAGFSEQTIYEVINK